MVKILIFFGIYGICFAMVSPKLAPVEINLIVKLQWIE